jgi:tetratricopeptide (TPR) repeat protein
MSDSREPHADPVPVQDLVAACLEKMEVFDQEALEAMCRTHPDAGDAIRARFETLRAGGFQTGMGEIPLLEPPSSTGDSENGYQSIGPYQPLKELGRGGQALVYLAEDRRLNRPVALKILTGFGPLSETTMERFRREAEVASKLDHPGICTVYDAGVEGGIPFIAMRYVVGMSLAQKIRQARGAEGQETHVSLDDLKEGSEATDEKTPVTPGTATRAEVLRITAILEKAARALHVAHEAGIIHRDIKPGNLMVTPSGEPVILDFGLAGTEAGEPGTLTRTGQLFGTPAYMSPEQLMAKRIRVDRRTDVYSLGATLYECLTLKRPFEAPTREAMYQAIQYKDPPDARKLNPQLPADLVVVVEKALEKDRDRRYATALDFAEDLRRVRERKPIAAKPVSMIGRTLRYARRRPARAALILLLIMGLPLVTGMGGYIVANQPEIEKQRAQAVTDEVERHLMAGYDALSMEGYTEESYEDPQQVAAAFEAALELQPGCAEAVAGKALVLLWQERAKACLDFLDTHHSLEEKMPALQGIRVDALKGLGKMKEAADLEAGIPPPKTALECFVKGSRLLWGRAYLDDPGQVRQAIDLLNRAALSSPHARLLYHSKLAHAIGRLAETAPARRIANALTTLWPKRPEAWFWASCALERVDKEESIRVIRQMVSLQPDSSFAHYQLGWKLEKAGLFDEAIAEFQKAVELTPDRRSAYFGLGFAYAKKRCFDAAVAAFEKAIALNMDCSDLYYMLGVSLTELGKLDAANASFMKAVEREPKALKGYVYDHCNRVRARGKPDTALTLLQMALKLKPEFADIHVGIGWALADMGKLDRAIAAYEKAIELLPDLAEAHSGLAKAYRKKGALDEASRASAKAITIYRKALELDPENNHIRNSLALFLVESGRVDEAIPIYEKAIRLDPVSPVPHSNLGSALARMGKWDEAITSYERATKLAPTDAMAFFNLGNALTTMGKWDEAIDAIEKAIELKPDLHVAYGNLGLAYMEKGKSVKALACFRRWYDLGSKQKTWGNPSNLNKSSIRQTEKRALRAVLHGGVVPEDTEECVLVAEFLAKHDYHVHAARFWRDALEEEPDRIEAISEDCWYLAARSAALAGCGKGRDARDLDDAACASWRQRALVWLQQALVARENKLRAGSLTRKALRKQLDQWLGNPDLAGLRDPEELKTLLPEERQACEAFWKNVKARLTRLEK